MKTSALLLLLALPFLQILKSQSTLTHCDDYEENSPLCNGRGTYNCQACHCPQDKFGAHCECDADNLAWSPGFSLEDGCKPDRNTTTLCNNRGDCTCGKCECHEREDEREYISGDFCECDNFSCARHKGLLCSGYDHGECVCGKCACNAAWDVEGYEACECRAGQDTCITPHGEHVGKVCSGHGTCTCGECACDGDYSGRYCEKCPNCPDKCQELKPCIQCIHFNNGEYMDGVDDKDEKGVPLCHKCDMTLSQVEDSTMDDYFSNDYENYEEYEDYEYLGAYENYEDYKDYEDYSRNDDVETCRMVDEQGCTFRFAYQYTVGGELMAWVAKNKECP